ncbi:hypothetical protein AURANDRAFT_64119 [Aureococcus anophagefferens]|uniref:ShKT domain-containing protein n=1 Tax=Aureococcus anophagefferens TaxID=44056 RepID=F0Y910_AURAN|nr:hypothetical protein AURANDRAFT_64119 [Aureococcus anophagefferens]EGB08422.1 hypothetical protein AURANDRAFT_64119 [Aureococcus anophagefferens]|eukprot:XP_009037137.1 hypothetical protein AURANDRAFT_64119 [Aureococcus anophagefferens]
MPPRWLSLCWLCALRRPRAAPLGGRGFLFASDEADLLLTAAARLKAVVPGARVAAVCDATGAAVIAAAETAARETLFDAVIVTAAVSRPEALNATPFDATVAFDADGLACDGFGAALDGDVWPALADADVVGVLDAEVPASKVRAKRYPARDVYKWSDTFLAFARTAETARLFEAWRAAGDLRRSLAERAVYGSLRTALLRPAPNCAAPTYQCGDNAWNPRGARACAVVHGRAFNDKDREAAESLDRRPPGGAAAVVARKGLLLREGYATDSDKVCEARKGSFVVALGPQRDVGGVCRLEVVTPEGLRGWCSLKAQLLAPRDDGEQPSAEEAMAELVVAALSSRAHRELAIEQLMFMGGERGAAGARAARGLVAIASSASGFEVASSRPGARDRACAVALLGWSGSDLCDLDLPAAVYAAKWPTADIIRYVEPTLVQAPLRCVAAGERALLDARLRAAVFESCPASDEPSSAELAATLDELLAELADPDATLKRFDAYDALVAEADRAARDAVPGLEAAVAQARFGDDFPSGPRQGGRVPGIPSLFLVPAGDPLVKEFLDARGAAAARDGLQRRDSTAIFDGGTRRGDHDPDAYGRAITSFLAGPCGLPTVRAAAPAPGRRDRASHLSLAPSLALEGPPPASPRSPLTLDVSPPPDASDDDDAPTSDARSPPLARRGLVAPAALPSPSRLSPASLSRDLPPSWAPLFPRLTKLDCGTNASNHALRVDRVVKALEALPDVAHVDFDGVSLGAGDLPRIVDAAGDRLVTIDFEDACVPVGDLVDCCARCPHLRRLTLPCTTGCPDLERRLGDVAAAAPKLAGCILPEAVPEDSCIGDEDLEPFFAGLALTHCEIRLSDYATNAALYCLLNGPSRETLRIFSVEHAPGVTIRGVLAVVMDCPRLSHLRWVASRDSEDLVDDLETIRDVLAPKRFHLPRWPGRRKSKTDVADAEVAIAVFFDVVLKARGGGALIELSRRISYTVHTKMNWNAFLLLALGVVANASVFDGLEGSDASPEAVPSDDAEDADVDGLPGVEDSARHLSEACADSETWYQGTKKWKTCAWVGKSPAKRCKAAWVIHGVKAKVACPVACGICPTTFCAIEHESCRFGSLTNYAIMHGCGTHELPRNQDMAWIVAFVKFPPFKDAEGKFDHTQHCYICKRSPPATRAATPSSSTTRR